jgi:small subunit ribosomal protein S8
MNDERSPRRHDRPHPERAHAASVQGARPRPSRLRAARPRRAAGEGYIRGYSLVENPGAFPQFEIELKYFDGAAGDRRDQARVSKPGRRVYSSIKDLKPIKNGLGISILSTPKGVMSDTAARDANVGGEVLCRVY